MSAGESGRTNTASGARNKAAACGALWPGCSREDCNWPQQECAANQEAARVLAGRSDEERGPVGDDGRARAATAAFAAEVRGAVVTTTGIAPPQRLPEDPRIERRREINRAWKKKQRDGQCEVITRRGTRCPFVGQYDGLTGGVRCGIHAE